MSDHPKPQLHTATHQQQMIQLRMQRMIQQQRQIPISNPGILNKNLSGEKTNERI